jgi:hypothetical protein
MEIMMIREYSLLANINVRRSIEALFDRLTTLPEYEQAMFALGLELGVGLAAKVGSPDAKIYLACNAEDADFLVAGVVESPEAQGFAPRLACFWNHRFMPFGGEDIPVAPIVKRYKEPIDGGVDFLIVVRSIISDIGVVRTNLRNLLQDMEPVSVVVGAPVICAGVEEKLQDEFDWMASSGESRSSCEKLDFLYFAKDDQVISGDLVFDRFGFDRQENENRHMPKIVEERMTRLVIGEVK